MLDLNLHAFHPLGLEICSPLNGMYYAVVDIQSHASLDTMCSIAPKKVMAGIDNDSSPTLELRRVSPSPRRWMYGDFVNSIQIYCTLL